MLFAHPRDAQSAVEYGLKLGSDAESMAAKPGETMGYLAFGHPFLDGNGRTIMVVHAELAERAGISVDWASTSKIAYLEALTREIEQPNARHLDAYLQPFLRGAVGIEKLPGPVVSARGIDGSESLWPGEDRVLGKVSDPSVKARYAALRLQRRNTEDDSQ